jgi:hypothetical protein
MDTIAFHGRVFTQRARNATMKEERIEEVLNRSLQEIGFTKEGNC